MFLFVVTLHVMLCLALIGIILLQPGKGDGMGATFGGGGGGMFGPRGPASLLSKLTTVVAVMFMVTSITLALYSNRQDGADSGVDALLEQASTDGRSPESASDAQIQAPDSTAPGALDPKPVAPLPEAVPDRPELGGAAPGADTGAP